MLVAGLAFILRETLAAAPPYTGKKVLFIDSYHEEYAWSADLATGIKSVLAPGITEDMPAGRKQNPTGIELKILYMDTKRNNSEAFKRQAALKAKAEIEAFRPDVVIACDDNASKYLIAPFYKDAELPFVFCGLNWGASQYGFPYKNVTGMIEVDLQDQIVSHLKIYAKGGRVGYIGADNETTRKNVENYQRVFGIEFIETYFLTDFATWKKTFRRAQEEMDMLLIGGHIGINDWDEADAKAFVEANIKIPTGTSNDWEMPYAVIGITKVPREQGIWAAQTALKILDGASPAEIPIATNKQGHFFLNLRLADKLGITFRPFLLKLADIIP